MTNQRITPFALVIIIANILFAAALIWWIVTMLGQFSVITTEPSPSPLPYTTLDDDIYNRIYPEATPKL